MNAFARKRRYVALFRLMMAFYKPRVYRPLLAMATMIALVSCTKSDDSVSNAEVGESPSVSSQQSIKAAAEATLVDFEIEIDAATTSVQLVAASEGRQLRLLSFKDSNGKFLYDANSVIDSNHSDSGIFQNSPLTYNYPLLASDQPLRAGRYMATYELLVTDPTVFESSEEDESSEDDTTNEDDEVSSEDSRGNVDLSVLTKSDKDLSMGTVNVNVVLSGSVANSDNSKDGVERAMEIVGQMLQRYQINIHVNYYEVFELPEVLPDPVAGDVLYEELAMVTEEGINIYFVSDVETGIPYPYSSATSAASPGPLIPSARSAISVSIREAAGGDGIFDQSSDDDDADDIADSEKRLLAESVAHELLSYLGLHDTVTFGGSGIVDSDGLDSEKCSNVNACEEDEEANSNIMFPYSLEVDDSDEEEYYPRDRLSPMQVELVQRSVALD